jgi:hypothetical protein
MASRFTLPINAALGSLVMTIGAGLAWDALAGWAGLIVLAGAGCFLLWRGSSIRLIWAWSTMFLGVECLAWPIMTMIRIRSAAVEPTDDEMGTILSAVIMGLFSAVFWLAFAYGLFNRADPNRLPSSSQTACGRPSKKR